MRYFDCPFCPLGERKNSLAYSSLLPSAKFEDEVLLESENFLVVPDAAPIVKGHALIVAKNHVSTAFGDIAQNYEEIERLIFLISNLIKRNTGFHCVAWEHGSVNSTDPSGCVEHAHVHVVPCDGMRISSLRRMLGVKMNAIDDMRNFINGARKKQYVALRKSDSRWIGAISDKFPSQCLRMSFGRRFDVSNCTWQERLGFGDSKAAQKSLISSIQALRGFYS